MIHETEAELFAGGLGYDRAGDARRRGAAGFAGDGMDHHRGAAIAEDGMAVAAERDIGSDDGGVSGAVGADDQREVGNVAGREPAVIVAGAVRIEVRASRLEVGAFAFGELVDMERVFAGRKVFDVELDTDALGSMRKASQCRLPDFERS